MPVQDLRRMHNGLYPPQKKDPYAMRKKWALQGVTSKWRKLLMASSCMANSQKTCHIRVCQKIEPKWEYLSGKQKKWAGDKKWADGCCWITCGARQRAATGVSLHELMERGGRAGGGRREEGREGGGKGGEGREGEEGGDREREEADS